jgi:hypothetical protein
MRAGMWAAFVAASFLGQSVGWAACAPGQTRNCVNLYLPPQTSQDIVATEHFLAPVAKPPTTDPTPPYTGPTFGVSHQVRQAPEIGYRWAIN